jgi:L1 cell adhesion molecule like protein
MCKVKSTAANTHLGGEDIDNTMVNYFDEIFKRNYKKDLKTNSSAVTRLRAACERAKCTLSDVTEARIKVDSLLEGIDINTSITRTTFEELNVDLFLSTMELVQKSLQDAKMSKAQIDDLVLIGGSTRIPIMQGLLQDFFNRKELYNSIKPDEAVAYGAAVQAAIIAGVVKSEKVQDLLWMNVTPMSLGIGTVGGKMDVFIQRNTPIPTKETKIYTVPYSNQAGILIQIFAGEKEMTVDNNFLGYLQLKEIPPTPLGILQIEVTFDIDANSILNVTAVENVTGKENKSQSIILSVE